MKKIIIVLALLIFISKQSNSQNTFYESFDSDTVIGVKGNAKLFDGYFTSKEILPTTFIQSPSFTINAWIALQEYATNVAAIVDKEFDLKKGYLLGVNQKGNLVANVAVNEKWLTLISTDVVPLLKWTNVALSVENGKLISIFINGKKSGSLPLDGNINFCDSCNLVIGKTQTKTTTVNSERTTSSNIKIHNRLNGLMDELYIYTTALLETEIAAKVTVIKVDNPQPLQYLQMPSGSKAPAKFGAYYTQLKYAPGWDALWRGSEYPDIVVRFDNSPIKYVFWRGTGYIPAVVNEKNMWMTDQSLEHWGTGECYEAMGDKQTRYTHVKIIESNAARVVIHWRYALAGIKHQFLPEDEHGWSDYADEYWTIYPDGIAARKQVLWSSRYEKDKGSMQWQETIFFCQPGTKPQDNVDMDALTLMDMQGNKKTYNWENGPPKLKMFNEPKYQPIEYINFKAAYKPFNIFDEKRVCQPFSFGNMKEYTTIPNWNHWPVQQIASDGTNAVAPDKPSHSSLTGSNGKMQIVEKKAEGVYWASSLKGMTDKPIDSLMALAKSWNNAPTISILKNIANAVYDKYSRAYQITLTNTTTKQILFTVNASAASPLYNLPLVIENWNVNTASVSINNKILKIGKDFYVSNVAGLDNNKVVLFIKIKANSLLNVRLIGK